MKKSLGFFVIIMLALFIVVSLTPTTAIAIPVWGSDATGELIGSRTSPISSGIDATGPWNNGDFMIEWEITDLGDLWKYEYTVTSTEHAISHFILEITEGDEFLIGDGSDIIAGPQTWTGGPGNPDMPNDIYGVKFDFGDNPVTYTLITDRDPVYGVFYAKDGKFGPPGAKEDIVAWSNALNYSDYRTNLSLTSTDFIVRPNGVPVPEPATMLLLGAGLLGIAGLGRKFKKI